MYTRSRVIFRVNIQLLLTLFVGDRRTAPERLFYIWPFRKLPNDDLTTCTTWKTGQVIPCRANWPLVKRIATVCDAGGRARLQSGDWLNEHVPDAGVRSTDDVIRGLGNAPRWTLAQWQLVVTCRVRIYVERMMGSCIGQEADWWGFWWGF